MTRLTAALVAAALLLPAGARAQGTAVTHGFDQCPQGWICADSDVLSGGQVHFGPPPHAEPDSSWHLLTISNGGTVSLIKGLTKKECDEAANRALPHYHLGLNPVESSDIKSAECFQ
jgi:hypothetical protein